MKEFSKPTAISVLSLMILTACGGSSTDDSGQNETLGQSDSTATDAANATGLLSLSVSDSPLHDAEKVCISFEAVEFKRSGDDESFTVDLDPAEKVDLLNFQGADAAPLLHSEELSAGTYDWVRLHVDASRGSNGGIGDTGGETCDGDASYIVMESGPVYNLFVPSGDQSGLKLTGGFVVPANGAVDVTAEWELGRSVVAPPGLSPDVILKPTIRLVNNLEVGTLAGLVDSSLVETPDCEPTVHVFADGVTPAAIDEESENADDLVATAIVAEVMNRDGTTSYPYEVGFLPVGSYEVAFTCDGQAFEPESGVSADIEAQAETVVDIL